MNDHDISTEQSRHLLSSAPDADLPGPDGWTRRGFLQAIGLGVAGGALLATVGAETPGVNSLLGGVPTSWAASNIGANDGILVTIMLYGGNDDLNTLVPYGSGQYYDLRRNLAVPPSRVLPIDGMWGFAPQLPYLKELWDNNMVAAVQGIGHSRPDLSHFVSMATWMAGRLDGQPSTSGWLGRWLDGQPAATAGMAATTIGVSVPLHMIGQSRKALAISPFGTVFGKEPQFEFVRMYNGIKAMSGGGSDRNSWHTAFSAVMSTQLDLARRVGPVFDNALPQTELAKQLTIAARLINADLGFRAIDVGRNGFDTHNNQPGAHAMLLADLDAGLASFFATLAPEYRDRVTLVTLSEFGRAPRSNDSAGTDHGTASTQFVIGDRVRGGFYGAAPSLSNFDSTGRTLATVDFRHLYGTLLDKWMGGGGSTILGGGYENLHLFKAGPGNLSGWNRPPVVMPPAPASGFVPMSPLRVFDTRDDLGGRQWAIRPAETWSFPIAGRYGIPADAVAVALNLTSVDATAQTFVTVWPNSETRPLASSLNPAPGGVAPNLVVARVGADGAVNMYNGSGNVHLVADVVGYFHPSSNVGLTPVTPSRLLDSRDGTGGRSVALGPGESFDLVVGGRAGAPAECVAVALNVTVTEPTAAGYLTVWPTGTSRPLASSVNMIPGQTVPNMVISQVGAKSSISIFNSSGNSHVVVDLLGFFAPAAGGRFVPISPGRVLDTRDGTGVPRGRLGAATLAVQVAGRFGVPASGVSGALLNVTAVEPSAATYITVFPTYAGVPTASNLNATAGQIIPNSVLARLGPDGAAAMFNFAGTTDLVADVTGYFTT